MVTMRVSDLITDPLLRLELATPSNRGELGVRITSAVATESIDPAAYLSPGTLVLTTGMGLNFDDPRIWTGYVERLLGAGISALAFGLGKPHQSVPQGLMDAAREHGLPVLAVPAEVPFLHLQDLVHRALAEEDFQASRLGWSIAEECSALASSGRELDTVLDHVATRSGVELRIVDDAGVTFAVGGETDHDSRDELVSTGGQTAALSLPLPLNEDEKWHLQCIAGADSASMSNLRTVLTPAAAVLSMVLSTILGSTMWESADSTEMLTALERTDESAAHAVESALRRQGLEISRGARLLSLRSRSTIRLHLLTWKLMRLFRNSAHIVPMETSSSVLLLIVPSDTTRSPDGPYATETHTAGMSEHSSITQLRHELEELTNDTGDSVFVSDLLTSPRALCLFTALHSTRASDTDSAPGVHFAGPPQVNDIINLLPSMLSMAISESILGPILSSGRASELLRSLEVFTDTSSSAQAAARLGVHRNTVRAHRRELEDSLGIDLASGADRCLCTLALAIHSE